MCEMEETSTEPHDWPLKLIVEMALKVVQNSQMHGDHHTWPENGPDDAAFDWGG